MDGTINQLLAGQPANWGFARPHPPVGGQAVLFLCTKLIFYRKAFISFLSAAKLPISVNTSPDRLSVYISSGKDKSNRAAGHKNAVK